MKTKTTPENLIAKVYRESKYKGKHVIIIGGKIYATKSGRASSELLDRLLKKYPKETPIISYIPEEESLILFLLSDFESKVPVGFLERDDLPPLLGRHQCLDTFAVLFSKFITSFSQSKEEKIVTDH